MGSSTILVAGGGTDSDALELMDDGKWHMNQKLSQVAGKWTQILVRYQLQSYFTNNWRKLLNRKLFLKTGISEV